MFENHPWHFSATPTSDTSWGYLSTVRNAPRLGRSATFTAGHRQICATTGLFGPLESSSVSCLFFIKGDAERMVLALSVQSTGDGFPCVLLFICTTQSLPVPIPHPHPIITGPGTPSPVYRKSVGVNVLFSLVLRKRTQSGTLVQL